MEPKSYGGERTGRKRVIASWSYKTPPPFFMSAKELIIKPISAKDANALVKLLHYSGKVVPNSQLHLGVFWHGRLEGAMQFGPSMRKDLIKILVTDTPWNGFLELNRMAFSGKLPRNSESRALSVAIKMIRKTYPHVEWIISFADGCQCGSGTIYRASGFLLVGIKVNTELRINPRDGKAMATMAAYHKGHASEVHGWKKLDGFMLRYLYPLNKNIIQRLTVPIIPFNRIDEIGAGMYKGKKITRTKDQEPEHHSGLGGETPTCALQLSVDVGI